MSEFISTCPKCRQQILCDTAYVGRRIACPVCMQEIQMPEPQRQPGHFAPAPGQPPAIMKEKSRGMMIMGGGIVILIAAVAGLVLHKSTTAATPAPLSPGATPVSKLPALPGQCRVILAFDQYKGDTVADASGNGNIGKVTGNTAVWMRSLAPDNKGLRLDGTNCVEIDGPVVDTAASFTVSAWVNLTALPPNKVQTFVSIDGKKSSGFVLGFHPWKSGSQGGRLQFGRKAGDIDGPEVIRAVQTNPISTNRWYHVTGVYNAPAQSISLYVNGKLEATTPFTNAWQATGKTVIGRAMWDGHTINFMNGIIRDVRLYSSALTSEQIKELAR